MIYITYFTDSFFGEIGKGKSLSFDRFLLWLVSEVPSSHHNRSEGKKELLFDTKQPCFC